MRWTELVYHNKYYSFISPQRVGLTPPAYGTHSWNICGPTYSSAERPLLTQEYWRSFSAVEYQETFRFLPKRAPVLVEQFTSNYCLAVHWVCSCIINTHTANEHLQKIENVLFFVLVFRKAPPYTRVQRHTAIYVIMTGGTLHLGCLSGWNRASFTMNGLRRPVCKSP